MERAGVAEPGQRRETQGSGGRSPPAGVRRFKSCPPHPIIIEHGVKRAYLDLEELLDRYLTKDDLKQIAEEYDLPKGGSKRELVARIASEVPHEDLLHHFH